MRALVTGAGGFVGANLVRRLVEDGHETIAIVRPGGDPWRLVGLGIRPLPIDLEDDVSIRASVLRAKPEVIFHLAAHGAYSWQQNLDRMLAVNLRCTQSLLEVAAEHGARVVNAGSSSEYGYKDHPPLEDEVARPNSQYAITKLAATHLCQLAAERYGVEAVTLRLYSVYGPWEEPGRLVPALVYGARAGRWPPFASPETARDFVWVDDVCEAFLAAATTHLTEPGAVFNIASGVQTTLQDLVAAASRVFGVDAVPDWGRMSSRAWDTVTWVGRADKAARELGWSITTTLADGLEATGKWFDAHPDLEVRYS